MTLPCGTRVGPKNAEIKNETVYTACLPHCNLPPYDAHVPFPAKPPTKTALLVLQGGLVCTAFRLPEDKKAV